MSQGISPILDFTAGTIAGSAALIVGFPFDTGMSSRMLFPDSNFIPPAVKVRLQNPSVGVQYRSTFHGVTTIIRQEGIHSLFRGISSPLVTAAPLNGLVFSSYKFFMRAQLDSEDSIPSLTQVTLAGAATGVVGSILTTPTELIKIQQQSQLSLRGSDKPPTFIDVARRILRQHGIRGLYRGITSTALRDTGYGAYFAAYEATLLYFPTRPAEPYDHTSLLSEADSTIASHSWFTLLLAGGLAGIAGWIVTFPFDVVKTRIQASHDYSRTNPYRNTWSAIIHSHRQDGLSVFFRGLAPTLIRAIPVNMVTFATFEAIVHAFS